MHVTSTAAGPAGKAPARVNNKKVASRAKRCVVTSASTRQAETDEERKQRFKAAFTQRREMDGVTGAAAGLSTPIFYGVSAIAAAAAAFGGYAAGSQAPSNLRASASAAGGAIGAIAVGAGAKTLKSKRDAGAGVELWNTFVDADDPMEVDASQFAAISDKYGAEQTPERLEALKQAYAAYLLVLIPPGDTPLRGDEHIMLRALLDKINLPDEEAAMCHTDAGRNLFRARLEVSGREAQFDELRTFQKLIYVSTQLFGELRAQFLTPWVARFGVTPEQVSVAKRNGAKTVMQGKIAAKFGNEVPATRDAMAALRDMQLEVKLPDEDCGLLIKDLVAQKLQATLTDAVALMRTRGASINYRPAVTALEEVLALSRQYVSLSEVDTTGAMTGVPGVGALTVKGTSFAYGSENDLLDLWKLYLKTKMDEAGTAVTAEMLKDLDELRTILNLPERKTLDMQATMVSEAYTTILRAAVKSGRLDESDSPAQVLNELITQVLMPGELASQLHDNLYREKLETCVRDRVISDKDQEALKRTARLLCISDERVAAVDSEVKGRIFRTVLRNAIDAGIDVFGRDQTDAVKTAKTELRMTDEDAFAVLNSLAKADLVKMINIARTKTKIENARALRQVVYFSNIILAPLVAICKGDDDKAAGMKELAETIAAAKKEAEAEEAAEKKEADDKAAAEAKAAEDNDASAEEDDEAKGDEAKAEGAEEKAAEGAEEKAEASTSEADSDKPASLAKAEKAKADRADGETITTEKGTEVAASSQKEITVEEDFSKADRLDTYKTYLIFCMTGDVVELPMGGSIAVERDETEFARLSQLGDILGLTQFDVYEVHSEMAEQAFKSQAESLTGGGTPNKQTMEKLAEMAKSMGLPDATAQKIIRGISNKKLVGNLQSMRSAGELTLDKVLSLVEQDIDVKDILPEQQRMVLYIEHIEKQLASGEGAIDTEYLMETLPVTLALDPKAATRKAQAASKSKVRTTMVQAVSYLRQSNPKQTFKYLNNLMACSRVSGGDLAGAAAWKSKEEVLDLYGVFCSRASDDAARSEIAKALDLSDEEASTVSKAVDEGTFGKAAAVTADDAEDDDSMF